MQVSTCRCAPEELLALQLVQLALDVADGVLQARLDHVLQRVHAPVGHLERRVQREERRLQVGQLHQQLHGLQVRLAASLYLLAAAAQACTPQSSATSGRAEQSPVNKTRVMYCSQA